MDFEKLTIVGAGSMGTALGKSLAESGKNVVLWALEPEIAAQINSERRNGVFLPDFELPENIWATSSLEEAVSGADIVLSVTPAQYLRNTWETAGKFLKPEACVVSASKGVETGSAKLINEVLTEVLGIDEKRTAFLSGPSFAKEIAAGQPTAVVVASCDEELARRIQEILSTETFRVYTTDDVVGVELGGALKNVIALAVGAAEGMGLGLNSRAALVTRGLAEISRLAVDCGANPLTLSGLAGMGDLVLTCTGHLSRNLQVGIRLGRGETLEAILGSMKMVAEGVATALSSQALARKRGVEMPITDTVVDLLEGRCSPHDAVRALMTRPLKSEREF